MGDAGPPGLRVWSGQTFHSFLIVLTISLIALIPGDSAGAIAVALGAVGATGIASVLRAAREARRDPDPEWRTRHALMRFVSPALAYAICLWAAVLARRGDEDALSWVVAVVFVLVMSAAASCWDLLKSLGDPGAAVRPADAAGNEGERR